MAPSTTAPGNGTSGAEDVIQAEMIVLAIPPATFGRAMLGLLLATLPLTVRQAMPIDTLTLLAFAARRNAYAVEVF